VSRRTSRPHPSPPGLAEAWDRRLERWNPLVVILLSLGGALAGAGVLLVGAGSDPRSLQFVQTPGFVVWASVMAVQVAVWAVLAVPLWSEIVDLVRHHTVGRTVWAIPAVVALALVMLAVFSPAAGFDWPLVGHHAKVWLLTALAALGVGLPAVFGIGLVQDLVRRTVPSTDDTDSIRMALASRSRIRRFLGSAGAVIGLAVLASGSLRLAVVPAFVPASSFPPVSVLLYGAFFSALLIVVYVPAHLSLRRLCTEIREASFPLEGMPPPTSAELETWLNGRKRIDTLTEANVTIGSQLQAAVFILAPLTSAAITTLLPKVG
jgi:hypothetical protein